MKSIDTCTKFLLKDLDWRYPKSLEEFGYIFFGPIIFNYFAWLKNESIGSDKILFNSREGYFLKEISDEFNSYFNLPKSVYFKTSRRLSSMAAFFSEKDVYDSFELHKFKGTFSELLYNRFGIISDNNLEINTNDSVPDLTKYVDNILLKSKQVRYDYGKYIKNIIGDSKNIIMVDNGYQGTTQYNIQKAYEIKFKGRYFTYKGNPFLNDVKGFYDFNNCKLKDNFIFFESLFIDKVGTYSDIIDNQFFNEESTITENIFNDKILIVSGIKLFIKNMLDLNVDMNTYSFEFSDYIFNLMCTPNYVLSDTLFDSFVHDNLYTRNFVKKIYRR